MDLWLVFITAFLILVAPRLINQTVSLMLSLRNKSEKKKLQAEILETRKELSKINQVDQFAKFARAERKLRAATDQLKSFSRQDLELSFKYALVGKALVYLFAVIFSFRLVYQAYALAFSYLVYDKQKEERAHY